MFKDSQMEECIFWIRHLQSLPSLDADPITLDTGWRSAFRRAFSLLNAEWEICSRFSSEDNNSDNSVKKDPTVFIESKCSNSFDKDMGEVSDSEIFEQNRRRHRIEVANYIAQLYYHYYIRTGDRNHLMEAFNFFRCVLPRRYNFSDPQTINIDMSKMVTNLVIASLLLGNHHINSKLYSLIPEDLSSLVKSFNSTAQTDLSSSTIKTNCQCCIMITDPLIQPRHAELCMGTILINSHLDRCLPPLPRVYMSGDSYERVVSAIALSTLRFKKKLVIYYCGNVHLNEDGLPALPIKNMHTDFLSVSDILSIRPGAQRTLLLIDTHTDETEHMNILKTPIKCIIGFSPTRDYISRNLRSVDLANLNTQSEVGESQREKDAYYIYRKIHEI